MREIKFRGKRVDNGEWVYGDLVHEPYGTVIQTLYPVMPTGNGAPERKPTYQRARYTIDPATVGQYTGLRDKGEKEVYEGDILRDILNPHVDENPYIVFYNTPGGGWFWKCTIDGNEDLLYQAITGNGEVIGNIYENSDLLPGPTP